MSELSCCRLLELNAPIVARYSITRSDDEYAQYFGGLVRKAFSLFRAYCLLRVTGESFISLTFSRSLLEALAYAISLNKDQDFISIIKKHSLESFMKLQHQVDPKTDLTTLKNAAESFSKAPLPNFETILDGFAREASQTKRPQLYSLYRMLSEYAHHEFFRTSSFPRLGPEANADLAHRDRLFQAVTIVAFSSILVLAHIPNRCGWNCRDFEVLENQKCSAWETLRHLADIARD